MDYYLDARKLIATQYTLKLTHTHKSFSALARTHNANIRTKKKYRYL